MIHKIGFIGLGIMGKAMASNLLKKGFEITGFVRRPEKLDEIKALGIKTATSIPDVCAEADCVITMVGGPDDVKEVWQGSNGVLASAKKGALVIDMTSSSPALAIELYEKGKTLGLRVLDAPVSGGDSGAKNATLSIFCGGDREDFEHALPVFEAMGRNIVLEGGPGRGQDTKLAAQIVVGGQLAGMCEGFAYAKERGLNLEKFASSLKGSAADCASLKLYSERVLNNDRSPGGALSYLVKDLKNALLALEGSGIDLNVTREVLSNYQSMQDRGMGSLGTQALVWDYAQRSGIKKQGH